MILINDSCMIIMAIPASRNAASRGSFVAMATRLQLCNWWMPSELSAELLAENI